MGNCNRKFDVYAAGRYLCTINQTLRVLQSAFDCERCLNAMQLLIDQHPTGLLIMPDGEHRKSKAITLAKIAPNLVLSCRRNNTKKRPRNTYLPGTRFSKKAPPANKDLQTSERLNLGKSKSGGIR